ncbi:MAG: hypothetical protein C4K47_00770 [Candidatus Thorarchaeota archaeon]|nr:MAG: hypothetical protein C4K47_00770 [Candidatus Thorarchaeota archaeon]
MTQNSKGKKEPSANYLDSFEFDPTGLDIKWCKNLISTLDGYRIHRCYDLTYIEKAVGRGDVTKTFIKQWGTIRSVLHKFAALGPDVPGVQQSMMRRQSVQLLSLILLTIALPLIVIVWILRVEYLSWFTNPFTTVTLVLFMITFITSAFYNRKIAWLIYHYVEDNAAMFGYERKHIKKWVQTLIYFSSRLLRKDNLKPEKNLVKFWNDDYDGIVVMKGPSKFRKHYVVKLKA